MFKKIYSSVKLQMAASKTYLIQASDSLWEFCMIRRHFQYHWNMLRFFRLYLSYVISNLILFLEKNLVLNTLIDTMKHKEPLKHQNKKWSW